MNQLSRALVRSPGCARTRVTMIAIAVSTIVTWTSPSFSSPPTGGIHVGVGLADAWGRRIDLDAIHAKPVLVVYESQSSAAENAAFKAELSALASSGRYESRVVLVAVADLEEWNFWPARGFVAKAIKDESQRQKTTIYCDWDGHFRSALGLKRGVSNIVVYGKSGRVVFAQAGPLSLDQRKAALAALEAELG